MQRRSFIKSSAMATGALVTGGLAHGSAVSAKTPAADKHQFNLKYAPHFGMFRNSAGDDLLDQIQFMADTGFTAMEDNGMMGRDVAMQEKIASKMANLGMEMGVFVVDKGGNMANTFAAGKQEYTDIFLDGCRRAVDVAKRVNAKWMTVVPGAYQRNLPIGIQDANVIDTLRKGAEIMEPHGLVMVLEPLSDSPDLYLRTSNQAYMICKAVNSPSCKILYDIYHMQKNEGNLITNMKFAWDKIAYIQVGDNPGRNEPTTGEINYNNVFKFIHETGYTGVIGMEHGNSRPGKEGETVVIEAYARVDQF